MLSVNNRIAQLRQVLKLSQDEFGERIAIVRSGISNIENGIRKVNDRVIKLICQEFDVNEKWLRTGIGEMFNTDTENILYNLVRKYNLDELDEKILLSYINLNANQRRVFKDYITSIIDKSEADFKPDNIIAFTSIKSEIPAVYKVRDKYKVPVIGRVAGGQPITAIENRDDSIETDIKCDCALELKGKSMEPDYPDGSILLINRQPSLEQGELGIIFILRDAIVTEVTFKRFYQDGSKVTLRSLNSNYPSQEYNAIDIMIYGKVVGKAVQ